jgi:hypothetical protein
MTAGTGSVWIEQAILKWADRREQEQGHIVDNLERELEQAQDAAHRKRIENHIAAATRRIARRKTFRAFDGANYHCPDCWIFQECFSIVRAIPSSDGETVLRCAMCDGEWRTE